ncbi:uncharacterized protein TEOVI_000396700 [Trypanosoma equiperdum]|uniref:Transmembrane protein n=1 Tax=Trypanosoma equiperdum TaxID=5694 RepID=A0A1G4IIP5_TRYEQ|nr:hypothetical protein, conserved [Trypanosoma equiperdum]
MEGALFLEGRNVVFFFVPFKNLFVVAVKHDGVEEQMRCVLVWEDEKGLFNVITADGGGKWYRLMGRGRIRVMFRVVATVAGRDFFPPLLVHKFKRPSIFPFPLFSWELPPSFFLPTRPYFGPQRCGGVSYPFYPFPFPFLFVLFTDLYFKGVGVLEYNKDAMYLLLRCFLPLFSFVHVICLPFSYGGGG